MRKWLMVFLLGGIVVGGIVFFSLSAQAPKAEDETGSAAKAPMDTEAHVKVAVAREGTLPFTIRALGKVGATSQTPAAIAAKTAGIVSAIAIRDGQQVTSGTVLIRFDNRAAQAALQKARSDLALAESEMKYDSNSGLAQQQEELDLAASQTRIHSEQADRDNERQAKLFAKSLVSEKAVTEARQSAETARKEAQAADNKAAAFRKTGKGLETERSHAKVEEARAALRVAEIESEAMMVRAPVAGRISRINVAIGQSVEKGALLADLEASEGIGATIALPPNQATRVKPAMGFTLIEEATSRQYSGKIIAVGAGLDGESGLVRAEGLLDPGKEQPPYLGEILNAEIITGQSPRGIIVPLSALSMTDEGAFIHCVDGKHQANRIPVQVLMQTTREALVQAEGIKAGCIVIIDGNYNLPDKATVVEERS